MIIQEYLENLSGNPTLIISPHGKFTRNCILNCRSEIRQNLTGLRIGLYIVDPGIALSMLAALDGKAEIIAFISPNADTEQVLKIASHCNLDAILSDQPNVFLETQRIPLFQDIESLAMSLSARSSPSETRWIFTTSGTTGNAKLVSHSLTSLTRTTKVSTTDSSLICWGLLYDYTRFAGLQVLLQSVLSGSTLIAPPLDDPLENKIIIFCKYGCTHLSGTPTIWRKILMTPGAENLKLKQVTLGGEIADDRILSSLSSFFSQARVTHVFASTEAGVGFSVSDKRAGFPSSFLVKPPLSIDIKINNDRLYIRNKLVCPNYVESGSVFAGEDGWVETGDIVKINGDRVLFLGRANGLINVGGDKVYPEEVEQVLLSHPLVVAARVYAKANPITGALVAADIILSNISNDNKDTLNQLRLYLRKELYRYKVPAIINIVNSFDTNAAGKLIRSQ